MMAKRHAKKRGINCRMGDLRRHFSAQLLMGIVVSIFIIPLQITQSKAEDHALALLARQTMEQAAAYYHSKLSLDGTFVWAYSPDLSVRRGEGGRVKQDVSWNQPPGTPAIGAAFLRVYQATGDESWLRAAHETALALARTQLISGGWFYHAEVSAGNRGRWCYRDKDGEECKKIKDNKFKNRTVLDDNTTQGVLSFLIWFDEISGGADTEIRAVIDYGLEKIIKSQYPNGAFPISSNSTEKTGEIVPSLTASLPPGEWPKTWIKPQTPPYFILNDDAVRDTIRLLLSAERRFGRVEYLDAAVRAGDFLLAAQLPAPQRGWAQTYDKKMQPVWGRIFEPPALASRESAGAVDALLQLYDHTRAQRFLEGAREGAEWLKKVRLEDGSWARFFELATDRPLFITSKNMISYSDVDLLDHYNLKNFFGIPSVLDLADRMLDGGSDNARPYWPSPSDQLSGSELENRARSYVARLDGDGRWIDDGWIKSETFVDAIFALSRYVISKQGQTK
jgi:hypothetical protein